MLPALTCWHTYGIESWCGGSFALRGRRDSSGSAVELSAYKHLLN